MNTYLIASMHENAGKTSFIVGLAAARKKKYGYLKPFGDRLIYRRKKNWDYDASMIIKLWGLDRDPDSVTLGFNHSKLRFVHNEENVRRVVGEMVKDASAGIDGLFIEGGKNIFYGSSVSLDSLTLASYTGAKVIFVVSGDPDSIMDDIQFIKKYLNMSGRNLRGIVINKVKDPEDFNESFMKDIVATGVPVLGIIPYDESLSCYSMSFLADSLFAKVLSGEAGLGNMVKHVLVGAMSAEACMREPAFSQGGKLLITSGDRDDMILAALAGDSAGVLLTNNIIPPSNIIEMAREHGTPLLLVRDDTFHVAKQIDRMDALTTPEDSEKIAILADLVGKNVIEDL